MLGVSAQGTQMIKHAFCPHLSHLFCIQGIGKFVVRSIDTIERKCTETRLLVSLIVGTLFEYIVHHLGIHISVGLCCTNPFLCQTQSLLHILGKA